MPKLRAIVLVLVLLLFSTVAIARWGDLLEALIKTGSRAGDDVYSSTARTASRQFNEQLAGISPIRHLADDIDGALNRDYFSIGGSVDDILPQPLYGDSVEAGRDSHTVYVAAPSDWVSYSNVFDRAQPGSFARELDNIRQFSSTRRLGAVFTSSVDGSRQFDMALQESKSKVFSIVGHNDKGYFRFPNGDRIHLADLADKCIEADKWCVFYSCDARATLREFRVEFQLAADASLTYREAIEAAARLDEKLAARQITNSTDFYNELSELVEESLSHAAFRSRIRVVSKAGATTGGAFIVITLLPSGDDK